MKTCLALTSLAALSLHSLTSAQDQKFPELLRKADVTINQDYTPFGNNLEFNKSGSDGSSCVLDASGVLTWIDNTGAVRVLPNTDHAVPLFVTSTTCLVWNNRFVNYDNYANRPHAEIKIFRAASGSTTVTEELLKVNGSADLGKEILETPPVTNATNALTFITATRKDNGDETQVSNGVFNDEYNWSDDCELRVYRFTAAGGVQFLKNHNLQVKSAADFESNSSGPNVSASGYGSDGSVVIEFSDAYADSYAVGGGQVYA